MNKKYIISLLSVFLLSGVCLQLTAQEDGKKKEDLKRELTLEREFNPTVQDANKVNVLPDIIVPQVIKRNIEFSRFVLPVQPSKEITILPSGKIMTAIDYNKRRGYFNFGIGNYMNINGDFGYHILSTDKDQLNVFLSHRSTNGKVKFLKDYAEGLKTKIKANDNIGGLNYSHGFDNATLRTGASFAYSGFNYYGYPSFIPTFNESGEIQTPTFDLEKDPTKNQINQTFNAHIGLESKENLDLGYLVDFGFTRFTQKYASQMLNPLSLYDGLKESNLYGEIGIFKPFLTDQRIGATAKMNYFTYGEPEQADSLSKRSYDNYMELTLNPYYQVEGESWNLRIGANLMFITGVNDKVFVSPDITAQIKAGEKATVYLSATGEVKSNSFQQQSWGNKYVSSYLRAIPSKTKLDAMLGVKANLGAGAWMNVYGGYRITDHELFYTPGLSSRFTHDVNILQKNSNVLKLGASFNYSFQQQIDFSIRGEYKAWDVKGSVPYTLSASAEGAETILQFDDLKAYGKPTFELNANIKLRPVEQLTLDVNYYIGTGREALIRNSANTPENTKMNAINDLNATAIWKLNDTFSVYAKANNLLFQKYDLFYGYPSQGLSLMGGININF